MRDCRGGGCERFVETEFPKAARRSPPPMGSTSYALDNRNPRVLEASA
jgi:hypothetical protein